MALIWQFFSEQFLYTFEAPMLLFGILQFHEIKNKKKRGAGKTLTGTVSALLLLPELMFKYQCQAFSESAKLNSKK